VSEVELVVVRDAEAAAREAGERLARAAADGMDVALSGGSVGPAYEVAACLQADWSRATVWWGDERAVPPDDERSNYLLARRTLLDALEREPAAVHRIRGELGAEAAAGEYDRLLEGVELGLALNGIGPDGHTASLFPNSPALAERTRSAVATEPRLEPLVPRVTLTPPVFAAAGELLYLVVGAGKAEAVRRAFADEPDPALPASVVRARRTVAVLDEAAATLLGR
jgi:6-phosphogluconolactonase